MYFPFVLFLNISVNAYTTFWGCCSFVGSLLQFPPTLLLKKKCQDPKVVCPTIPPSTPDSLNLKNEEGI